MIRYPKAGVTQLFDLGDDPDELHNLAADPAHKQQVADLLVTLKAEQKKWGDDLPLFPDR